MSLRDKLLRFAKNYAHDLLRETFAKTKKSVPKPKSGAQKNQNRSSRSAALIKTIKEIRTSTKSRNFRNNSSKPAKNLFPNIAYLPPANAKPQKWNLKKLGLPPLSYSPDNDNMPDPGEVVWTWVPYEELDGRGKDRPVLVVSMLGDYIIFAQMTSQDRACGNLYQDEHKRWWLDIGTGDWDYQGRPSEVRLDLLWVVHISQVRRMGGKLSEAMYSKLAVALRKIHGKA